MNEDVTPGSGGTNNRGNKITTYSAVATAGLIIAGILSGVQVSEVVQKFKNLVGGSTAIESGDYRFKPTGSGDVYYQNPWRSISLHTSDGRTCGGTATDSLGTRYTTWGNVKNGELDLKIEDSDGHEVGTLKGFLRMNETSILYYTPVNGVTIELNFRIKHESSAAHLQARAHYREHLAISS